MKIPDPESVPRIDVSCEELEALLEQAKQEPLREDVNAFVALQAFDSSVCCDGNHLGEFCFPGAGRSFREDRFLHLSRQEDDLQRHRVGDVFGGLQFVGKFLDRREHCPRSLKAC